MKDVTNFFTSHPAGKGIVLFAIVAVAVTASNIWLTPMAARAINGMSTTPPVTTNS